MYALVDDILYEVDESEVELEGNGFWLCFEDEDEDSFYEFDESIDPDDFE